MKRFIEIIGSRRFAIWMLVVTTAIILLSNLLPKPYVLTEKELEALRKDRPFVYALSERYNVARVTQSPPFIAVVVFLFLSVTACTAKRTKRFLERDGTSVPPPASSIRTRFSIGVKDAAMAEDLIKGILGKRWNVLINEEEGKRIVYARKGTNGFWGSVAFHAGMCIVLVGALISAMTRYNGRLVLAEGLAGEPYKILGGLTKEERNWFPVREMMMGSFRPEYKGPFPVDYKADIMYTDLNGLVRKESVRVNEPLRVQQYQFILTRYGFAPRFILKDSMGNIISDDVIILVVITPEKEDSFRALNGQMEVRVRFYPDFYMDKGIPRSRSRFPGNPTFSANVLMKGRTLGSGLIPIGGALNLGGYSLEFKDLHYWAQLDVSRDSGLPLIMAGFFVIIAGLSMRLLLNERAFWAIISGNELAVGGRSSYFPALFEEELKRLAEEIRAQSGARSQESEG